MPQLAKLANSNSRDKTDRKPAVSLMDQVENLAQKCLGELQKHIFQAEEFELKILNGRGLEARHYYAVLIKSENTELVMKIDFQRDQQTKFQREILAQRRLYDIFQDSQGLHVPKVVFVAEDLSFFAMECVAGVGAQHAVRNHVLAADENKIFHQAGRWLAKIHGLRASERIPLSPTEASRNLTLRLRRPEAKLNGIYKADIFHKCYQAFQKTSDEFNERANPLVLGHGDFHGENLIFNGVDCTGLDFCDVRRMPAGVDIARFLVHTSLAQYENPDKIGPLGLVQAHVDAFFDGYGMNLESDHVFNYFIKLRLLEGWSKLPGDVGLNHVSLQPFDLHVSRCEMAFLA